MAIVRPIQRSQSRQNCLQIQLRFVLDWNKPHRRPMHCFGDRLRIDVVVLAGLHERPNILGWHELHVVTLLQQNAIQKCAPGQASMPIRQVGRFAANTSCLRLKRFFVVTWPSLLRPIR